MSVPCRAARAALELRNVQSQLASPTRRKVLARCLLQRRTPVPSRRLLHTSPPRTQHAEESSPTTPFPIAQPPFNDFGASPTPIPPKPETVKNRDRRDISIPMDQFQGAEQKLGHFPARKHLWVNLNDKPYQFDNVFLRDACSCASCLDPDTKQKLFKTTDINPLVFPKHMAIREGRLHILWSDVEEMERQKLRRMSARHSGISWSEKDAGADTTAGHHSVFTFEFLQRYSEPRNMIRENHNDWKQLLWGKKEMERDVLHMEYEEYMMSDESLWKFVNHMSVYGLAFLKNVPEGKTSSESIEGICHRIGNLKDTFYGRTWDVKNVPDPKNIAYTSKDLGLHMDLLYFESPPGLQFLHCLRNAATGGASYFADSFRAADTLRLKSPAWFKLLTKFPVPFHYNNDNRHYYFTRPTIVVEKSHETYFADEERYRISHVNYAPPFQAPFEMDHGGFRVGGAEWRKFFAGFKQFVELVEDPESQYETRLEEGDVAVFANRRVLHARREFDPNSGERWLKGAYIDIDVFRSAYRVLQEKFKKGAAEEEEGPRVL